MLKLMKRLNVFTVFMTKFATAMFRKDVQIFGGEHQQKQDVCRALIDLLDGIRRRFLVFIVNGF